MLALYQVSCFGGGFTSIAFFYLELNPPPLVLHLEFIYLHGLQNSSPRPGHCSMGTGVLPLPFVLLC